MKQRSFILVEILICIAILLICAIPMFGYPFFHFKFQKTTLLNIEKQRQAEIIFYDFLKNVQNTHTWNSIDRKYMTKHNRKKLHLNIDGLGHFSFNTHMHLYHCHNDDSCDIRKVWVGVCFEDDCKYKKGKNNPYQFVFFSRKKVEKKPHMSQKENK